MQRGRRIKQGLKRVQRWTARAASVLWPPSLSVSRILTYHSVGQRDHEMNVMPEAFRRQMAWLAEHVPVIPLEEAVEGRSGVAITFDDGYRDNLENAAPILREFGFPATLFMVAGRAGGTLKHDRESPDSRLLTWEELRQWAGDLEVGAHTLTHCRLSRLDEAGQRAEIVESKARLEEELGCPVRAFAYPFGSALDYNQTSVRLVREAGYAYAVSNRFGPNRAGADRWTLRRIWIDATDNEASFQDKVIGRLDILRWMDSPPGIALRRVVNRALNTR